jgi:magnesium chelatase family protein
MSVHYPEVFTLLNGDLAPRCQEIEIASSFQIPFFQIIGLPGPEVSEAKDRIRSAIEACGLDFPRKKIILNLSPASVRKKGTGLDLAMAVAVLVESWKIEERMGPYPRTRVFAWGELGLDGRVKGVRSPARAIEAAIRGRADLLLVAKADEVLFRETAARLFKERELPAILGLSHLRDAEDAILNKSVPTEQSDRLPKALPTRPPTRNLLPIPPMVAEVLQIAAAGGHHFLMLGPKGVGKSLALEWFLALQPELECETVRTRRFLAEISGREDESPYRRVSPQAKPAALLGSFSGGQFRPGEFSLAHGGVLLADEFPEWSRDAREALREPLERKRVTLTRVDGALELPSDFIFAGNGNLCPCGGVPDAPTTAGLAPCTCLSGVRERYFARLSGPILDRLDLVIHLLPNPKGPQGERDLDSLISATKRTRTELVSRFGSPPGKLTPEFLENLLEHSPELRHLLDAIPFRSFRDRHKTLRIALTLTALRGKKDPDAQVLREVRALRIQSEKSERMPGGA